MGTAEDLRGRGSRGIQITARIVAKILHDVTCPVFGGALRNIAFKGVSGYAGSNPYRSRFENRLRATKRVSAEDEAQWGEISTWLYTAAQL